MAKETVLYLVIPCFNEGGQEGALPLTAPLFLAELERLISQQKIADASRMMMDRMMALGRRSRILQCRMVILRAFVFLATGGTRMRCWQA